MPVVESTVQPLGDAIRCWPVELVYRHKKQSGGSGQYAEVNKARLIDSKYHDVDSSAQQEHAMAPTLAYGLHRRGMATRALEI
jgi:hypothetical protein